MSFIISEDCKMWLHRLTRKSLYLSDLFSRAKHSWYIGSYHFIINVTVSFHSPLILKIMSMKPTICSD